MNQVLQGFRLSWDLRNSPDVSVPGDMFSIVGVAPGEYPIDGWKPYFLEIPADGLKADIVGRISHAFGVVVPSAIWNRRRIVTLPRYSRDWYLDMAQLATVVRGWSSTTIPDDIPCLAVALRSSWHYGEDRLAQSVAVLMIWNDSVCRLLRLDWSEGPLEDCITPEWCIQGSGLLSLSGALGEMESLHRENPGEKASFSLFVLPSCLGKNLRGRRRDAGYSSWKQEWSYVDHRDIRSDLRELLSQISRLFASEGVFDWKT